MCGVGVVAVGPEAGAWAARRETREEGEAGGEWDELLVPEEEEEERRTASAAAHRASSLPCTPSHC